MATTSPSTGLGGFWRDLPREGRLMLSIVVLEFLGTGLAVSYTHLTLPTNREV